MRLLGPRTLRLMTANQLPGHADLEAFGRPLFAETTFDGVGFGLGFSVVEDPVAARYPASARRVRLGRRGQHGVLGRSPRSAWRCSSSRSCCPSSTHPIRSQLHQLVHQALID